MRTQRTRIDFRSGGRLAGADLAAMGTHTTELLMLHQARLHGVWGIATGFEASLAEDAIRVRPGLALDARGHTLLLPATSTLRLPQLLAGERAVLVAAWADRLPAASDPLWQAETARLAWLPPETRPRGGLELQVAAVARPAAGGEPVLDLSGRRIAHGLVRPRIATGHVLRSSLAVQGTNASWLATVPTAAAGFTTASPAYFVTLDDHPWGPTVGLDSADHTAPPPPQRFTRWLGPCVAVETQAQDWFTLRVSAWHAGWWGSQTEPRTNPVGFTWLGVDTSFQPFLWFGMFPDSLLITSLFGGIHG